MLLSPTGKNVIHPDHIMAQRIVQAAQLKAGLPGFDLRKEYRTITTGTTTVKTRNTWRDMSQIFSSMYQMNSIRTWRPFHSFRLL